MYGAHPLLNSPETRISVRTFANNQQATIFFNDLKACKGDRVADCRFIHENKVIMDRVEVDLETWIADVGKAFKGGLKEWWGEIRDRFISVFG